ncbi:MBL fold metallo-hydrolase [Clostridium sp. BJN0001]|uniref:MBL fold metallo-hydrolase n=1 Tax=Clostridium sp. BJN0001 TaxID=2930219 RepID=UPI001FD05325|nr:MBL fold metallo-hydrolase [Clostridium sp. BJN0001]
MQITWYGHSCFLIKNLYGKRILIDPFPPEPNYNYLYPKCDLITISHNHIYNSYINEINKTTKIINQPETFSNSFCEISGYSTYHDQNNGLKRGSVIIYKYTIDNITLCHLSDTGCIPNEKILKSIKNTDILFIPIGGQFTLDGFKASILCSIINAKFIIPMNYKTEIGPSFLNPIKDFIINMKNIKKINSNSVDITFEDIKSLSEPVVLLFNINKK